MYVAGKQYKLIDIFLFQSFFKNVASSSEMEFLRNFGFFYHYPKYINTFHATEAIKFRESKICYDFMTSFHFFNIKLLENVENIFVSIICLLKSLWRDKKLMLDHSIWLSNCHLQSELHWNATVVSFNFKIQKKKIKFVLKIVF